MANSVITSSNEQTVRISPTQPVLVQGTAQQQSGISIPPGMMLARNQTGQLLVVSNSSIPNTQAADTKTQSLVSSVPVSPKSSTAVTVAVSSSKNTVGVQSSGGIMVQQSSGAILTVVTDKFQVSSQASSSSSASSQGSQSIVLSQKDMATVSKCRNFLTTLIKLASAGGKSATTVKNVRKLVQDLIDDKIQPEHFTQQLQIELNSAPQPYLVPFLKKSLPLFRLRLMQQSGEASTVPPAVTTVALGALTATTVATTTVKPGLISSSKGMQQMQRKTQPKLKVINKKRSIPDIRPPRVTPTGSSQLSAEGNIADTESRLESLKSQNDHLRALVDTLTAELMSTQDLVKSTKEEVVKQLEESQKKEEEWKKRFEKEMREMKKLVEQLAENKETITPSGDGSQHGSTAYIPDAGKPTDFHILEADQSKKAKDQKEDALESDMLSLLGALKSQSTKREQEQTQQKLLMSMDDRTTEGAAQTVAIVVSQLRHLQRQHAEAQNRLQELTQVAGFLAGKVAETERSQSSASSRGSNHVSDRDKMLKECSSSASIESGPITPWLFAERSTDGFQFMIPTSDSDTDDAVSGFTITSSMFATTGGDYPGPSELTSRIGLNEASPVLRTRISGPGTSSSESLGTSDHSFKDVPKNVPALLQTDVLGMKQRPKSGDAVSNLLHHLNTKCAELSALPPFNPTGAPVLPEPSMKHIVTSKQQTQLDQ